MTRVPSPVELAEDVWPRDDENRWRIYARRGDRLEVLAATGTAAGVGVALVTLDEDARDAGEPDGLGSYGAVGVLDATEGRWLLSPWHRVF